MNQYEKRREDIKSRRRFDDAMKSSEDVMVNMLIIIVPLSICFLVWMFYMLS